MRLNNDMKSRITERALTGTLKKREESLKTESNALALLVYDQLYPTDIQTQMNKLPDTFFHQSSVIYVQLTSSDRSDDLIKLELSSSRKIKAIDHKWKRLWWNCIGTVNAITSRIDAMVTKRRKLELDRNNLREKLRVMLNGITTTEQLAKEWPDGIEYYKDLQNRYVLVLDGVPISGFIDGDWIQIKDEGNAAIQASVASLNTCVKGLQDDSIKNREKIDTLDQRVQHLEDKARINLYGVENLPAVRGEDVTAMMAELGVEQ